MLEFKMLTAVGIKERLKSCLFQAGTLNLRPEGIIWNSRNKGWAESEIIFLLFLVTKSLKITWRASCCLPVNLLAKFTTLFNLFYSVTVSRNIFAVLIFFSMLKTLSSGF